MGPATAPELALSESPVGQSAALDASATTATFLPMMLAAKACVEAAKKRPGSAMMRTPRSGGKWRSIAALSAAAISLKDTAPAASLPGKPPPTSRRCMGLPRAAARRKTASARAMASANGSADPDPEPT